MPTNPLIALDVMGWGLVVLGLISFRTNRCQPQTKDKGSCDMLGPQLRGSYSPNCSGALALWGLHFATMTGNNHKDRGVSIYGRGHYPQQHDGLGDLLALSGDPKHAGGGT